MNTQAGKPRAERSLTTTLALSFLVLSVAALLVSAGVQLFSNIRTQQAAIASNQQLVAQEATRAVSSFLQEHFRVLETAVWLNDLDAMPNDRRKQVLQALLGLQPSFRQLVMMNSHGRESARASRLSLEAARRLTDQFKEDTQTQVRQAKRYISPVYIDQVTSEPWVIMAVPVTNVFGDFQGTLMADVNLKFIWEVVDRLKVGETGRAYVVDDRGTLIAFGDTARVLKGEQVDHLTTVRDFIRDPSPVQPRGVITYRGILGTTVVGTYVALERPHWAVVTELPWTEAYRETIRDVGVSLGITLAMAISAGFLGAYVARRLTVPLVHLTETATRIAGGERDLQAGGGGPKEVASLASAFNSMTAQLRETLEDLEQRFAEQKRAEAALRVSEERLRLALEGTSDAIWDWNIKTGEVYFSPRYYTMLGYAPGEFPASYESWRSLLHPDDAPAVEQVVRDHVTHPIGAYSIEFRMKAKNGEWRWILSRGTVVEWEGEGQAVRVAGSHSDIGERKRAEAELERAHLLLEAVLDQSPVPMVVASAPDLVVRYASRAAADYLGASDEPSYLGLTLPEVQRRQTWRDLHPDGTPLNPLSLPIARALRGETIRDEEYSVIRKDGTQRWEIVSGAPVYNRVGDLVAGVIAFPDITERKRVEEVLRRRTQQLEAIGLVSAEITRELDLTRLLGLIHRRAAELLGARSGFLSLYDETTRMLTPRSWEGHGDWVGNLRFRLGEGVSGTVAERRRGMVVNDYRSSLYAIPMVLEHSSVTSIVAEPLMYRDRLVGVVTVDNQGTEGRSFTEENREILTLFAVQAAIAIENARLYADAQRELAERTRTEAALQESEQRFRTLAEAAFEGIALTEKGVLLDANDQLARMLGCDRSDLVGRPVEEFIAPEALELVRQVQQARRVEPYEHLMLRRNGTTFPVEVRPRYAPIGGRLIRISAIRDITERKRAEDALRIQAQQLEAIRAVTGEITRELDLSVLLGLIARRAAELVGAASGAVVLWDEDAQTLVPAAWHGHEDWFGAMRFRLGEGVLGTVAQRREGLIANDYRTSPYALQFFAARTAVTAVVAEPLLYRGQFLGVVSADIHRGERVLVEGDRYLLSLFAAQAAIAIENARLFDAAQRELAERTRAEAALRQANLVVENSPAVLFRWKAVSGWPVEYVSENVTQFGYSPQELLSGRTPYTSLVHPEDLDRLVQEVQQYSAGAVDRFQQEYRIITRDGRVRWVDDRTAIERDADGGITHYQGMVIDISERKRAEEQLQNSLREKEVLLREVHHRVKNNMQIISSLLRLQSRRLKAPEVQELFRESQNRVRSMALVHELLYQSQDLARVNLSVYFKTLAQGLYRAYGADPRRIALTLEVDEIVVGVDVAIPCGLVVGELLSNALKHAFPPGRTGTIRIRAHQIGESEVDIAVKDDGVGMPPESALDDTASLGLRLVRMLTEDQLRGEIQILRQDGTECCLRFPMEKR